MGADAILSAAAGLIFTLKRLAANPLRPIKMMGVWLAGKKAEA